MDTGIRLSIPGMLHAQLRQHLIVEDGSEAAAILVCKPTSFPMLRFLAKELILVPHEKCRIRRPDFISWPGEFLERAIDKAELDNLSLFLVHSHPGGLLGFSQVDDQSDQSTIPCLHQGVDAPHGSLIMVSNGAMIGRIYDQSMNCQPLESIVVVGDDISFWWNDRLYPNSNLKRPVAYTEQMTSELGRLSAVVVGVSGIGSIVAELLSRLGFGKIVLIDFDRVEYKNLNRILNAGLNDAKSSRLKVELFVEAIERHRPVGTAVPVPMSINSREAVLAAAQCDVLFSCVDTLEARQICDSLASRFLIPLFDSGVTIPTRKAEQSYAIGDVCGRIDYVQPGGATLYDRGVYSPESLRAEHLRQVAPDAHEQELNAGYIKGVHQEAPAVISLNMRAASACVNEFLARAYPFRLEDNRGYARTEFSLAACEEEYLSEDSFPKSPNSELALGDEEPLLGLPNLRQPTR